MNSAASVLGVSASTSLMVILRAGGSVVNPPIGMGVAADLAHDPLVADHYLGRTEEPA